MRFGTKESLEYKNFLANHWKDIIKFKRRPEAERKDVLAAEREKTEEEKFVNREKRRAEKGEGKIEGERKIEAEREGEKDRSRERRQKDRREGSCIEKTEKTSHRTYEGEKKEVASQGQEGKRPRPQEDILVKKFKSEDIPLFQPLQAQDTFTGEELEMNPILTVPLPGLSCSSSDTTGSTPSKTTTKNTKVQLAEETTSANRRILKVKGWALGQSQRIVLNVGRTKFQTSASTLQVDPSSLLALLVSPQSPMKPHEVGSIYTYFLDRDPKHFGLILNYLRTVSIGSITKLLPPNFSQLEELALECRFMSWRVY
ncbi:hypothetical protein SNE40_013656 [Patella caerulea]